MADQTALERHEVVVPGERSELRLEAGRVLVHKDATTQSEPTEVAFGVDEVRGATLNPPSRGQMGWLHVSVVGGSPPPPTSLAAMGDPYTLPLTSRGLGAARRLVRMVERHVQVRGMPSEGPVLGSSSGVVVNPDVARAPNAPSVPPAEDRGPDDLVARLKELADLHEAGALTDEEFERAKARVLG